MKFILMKQNVVWKGCNRFMDLVGLIILSEDLILTFSSGFLIDIENKMVFEVSL